MKIRLLLSVFIFPIATVSAIDLEGLVTPDTIAAHHEALNLTPAQESELTQIYETAKSEAAGLEASVRNEENKLKGLLRSEALTTEAADAQLQSLLDAEAAFKKLQLKTLVALRLKLTPEQLAKAITLANQKPGDTSPLEAQIEAKANRLKAAFDELEIKLSPALQEKGDAIMELVRNRDLAAADKALDQLIIATGIDDAVGISTIDFSTQDPGDTDLDVLRQRFESVEAAAANVISLPLLRQLIQGRDALELAKTNEDAIQAGRILTWAENLLAQ